MQEDNACYQTAIKHERITENAVSKSSNFATFENKG